MGEGRFRMTDDKVRYGIKRRAWYDRAEVVLYY